MPRCIASKSNGEPCGGYAVQNSRFCFTHDPGQVDARVAAHRKGGQRNRGKHAASLDQLPLKARSSEDVLQILDYILLEVKTLENSISRGRLIISLASEYLHALQVGELEKRVAVLESLFEHNGIIPNSMGGKGKNERESYAS